MPLLSNTPTGSVSAIGTTAVQFTVTGRASYGVEFYAPAANTAGVYIGVSSGLTAGTADATDGRLVEPGGTYFLPIALLGVTGDTGQIYFRAASGTQKLSYSGA